MKAQNGMAAPRTIRRDEPNPFNPVTVFRELFELLEDYGPAWYTEEMHKRATAALTQNPH